MNNPPPLPPATSHKGLITIAILTLMGEHLKEIFQQVTANLKAAPQQ
jgi:hypothetical protein